MDHIIKGQLIEARITTAAHVLGKAARIQHSTRTCEPWSKISLDLCISCLLIVWNWENYLESLNLTLIHHEKKRITMTPML